jgi:hypothetical protein
MSLSVGLLSGDETGHISMIPAALLLDGHAFIHRGKPENRG